MYVRKKLLENIINILMNCKVLVMKIILTFHLHVHSYFFSFNYSDNILYPPKCIFNVLLYTLHKENHSPGVELKSIYKLYNSVLRIWIRQSPEPKPRLCDGSRNRDISTVCSFLIVDSLTKNRQDFLEIQYIPIF